MIDPQNTAITIEGELVQLIQEGKAISLGLMIYDVEADRLVFVGMVPDADVILSKFQISTARVK